MRVITVDVTSSVHAEHNMCSAVAMWMVKHKHIVSAATLLFFETRSVRSFFLQNVSESHTMNGITPSSASTAGSIKSKNQIKCFGNKIRAKQMKLNSINFVYIQLHRINLIEIM